MPADNFPHDAAYKAFFSNPDMVKSLLLDFVPEEFVKYFNFDALEECSSSYISSDLQQRHDDIVWRVRWRNVWCYIYILLEFQSSQDYWMPLRILTYTALLWENLVRQGILKTGDKLPPIFPIVIYNGEGIWRSVNNIRNLIVPLHDSLSDYQPAQKYFLIDENRISQLLLDNAKGESAYIFRLEQASTANEILTIAHEISKRLDDPKYDFLRRSIYSWINRLLRKRTDEMPDQDIETVEDAAMLEQRIAQWEAELMRKGMLIGEERGKTEGFLLGEEKGKTEGFLLGEEKGKTEGLMLGKEKGKAEGLLQQKMTLFEMFMDRFEAMPTEWAYLINRLDDPKIINQLTRAVYKVNSPQEFYEMLTRC